MRSARLAAALVVAALLAASLVPPEALVRFGERALGRGGLEAVTVDVLGELPWLLRGLALLGAAWLLLRPLEAATAARADSVPGRPRGRALLIAIVVGGMLLSIVVRAFVLRSGLISGDEWNNEFTARLFAQGRLWDAPPPHPEFFRFTYFVTLPDRTFSIFPPLWPAVLAVGDLAGIGAWINLLVAGVAAALVGLWNRGRVAALAAALVLVLSPMFTFTAASSFASPTVLACLMAELWCLRRALEAPPRALGWMAGAGLLWGLCFTAHYPTAVGAGLPPLLFAAWRIARDRRTGGPALAAFALAALPLVALGAYHHALHGGAPWVLPASLYEESMIRPGFDPAVLLKGAAYTALHTVRLLGWTFPLLPLLACLAPRAHDPGNRLLWLSILGLVAFYFFYPSAGGPQYGPRYYFGLLGPLAILAGQAVPRLVTVPRGRAFLALLAAGAIALFGVRARLEHERAAQVNAPFRLAAEAHLTNAIVFMQNVNRADHARNPPGWSAPVLFVPDLGPRNAELRALFPGRAVYLYRRAASGPEIQPEVVVPPRLPARAGA